MKDDAHQEEAERNPPETYVAVMNSAQRLGCGSLGRGAEGATPADSRQKEAHNPKKVARRKMGAAGVCVTQNLAFV